MDFAKGDFDYLVFLNVDADASLHQVIPNYLKYYTMQVGILCHSLQSRAHLSGIWQSSQSGLGILERAFSRRELFGQCNGSPLRRIPADYTIGGQVSKPILLCLDCRDLCLDCRDLLLDCCPARADLLKRSLYAARLLQLYLDGLLQRLYYGILTN